MEGTYNGKYTLISSDVQGSNRAEQLRWRFEAQCKEGGSCNVRVESLNNDWKATGVWRKGSYRWARPVKNAYTCGSPGNVDYYIDASYEYTIHGRKVRFVNGEWVISSFEGTFTAKGLQGCGLSGPSQEKYALQGTLKSPNTAPSVPNPG